MTSTHTRSFRRLAITGAAIAICLCIVPLAAWAVQTDGWGAQTSGTANDLYAVQCVGTTACYAVGEGGTIDHSADGSTWATETSPTTNILYAISCLDATHCFASGDRGTIVSTGDGSTWATVNSGTGNTLYGLACVSTTQCWTAGSSGEIRETTDGSSFSTQSSHTSNTLYGIDCPDSTHCVAVGASRTSVETSNGTSWAEHNLATNTTFYGVSCPSTSLCVAVGAGGAINTSTNLGTSWTSRASGTTNELLGVTCESTSVCFATGSSGTILKSSNGGSNWSSETSPTPSATLTGTTFPTAIDGWGAGLGGVINRFDACGGASLALTVPSTISWAVTLNGADQTTSTPLVVTADDESGARAGWNITGTSTTFKNAASKLLPTTATSLTSASAVAATGNCNTPANSIVYPVTLPAGTVAPTAVKLYDATSGTGRGPSTVTLNFTIAAPANIYTGTYSSTWTFSIVSGP
ncbi:MAG TPA: hypothetical protein VG652_04750 [Gaiellaceae bacterium]|nr:hypothetical protein [Gaiellaceae bacterium]